MATGAVVIGKTIRGNLTLTVLDENGYGQFDIDLGEIEIPFSVTVLPEQR